jgi:hypothetical protein
LLVCRTHGPTAPVDGKFTRIRSRNEAYKRPCGWSVLFAYLLRTVVGSGIMAERLAGGNEAVTLLGNAIPTGAILVVLITILGPLSGAHFNPAVTVVMARPAGFRVQKSQPTLWRSV